MEGVSPTANFDVFFTHVPLSFQACRVRLRRLHVAGNSMFGLGKDYSLGKHSVACRANRETFVRSQRLRGKRGLRDQLERCPCVPLIIAPMTISAAAPFPCRSEPSKTNTHAIPGNRFSRNRRNHFCRTRGAQSPEHVLAFASVCFPAARQRRVFLRHLRSELAPVANGAVRSVVA
jgi:hypothetical protein